jgi:hypothetical protein
MRVCTKWNQKLGAYVSAISLPKLLIIQQQNPSGKVIEIHILWYLPPFYASLSNVSLFAFIMQNICLNLECWWKNTYCFTEKHLLLH